MVCVTPCIYIYIFVAQSLQRDCHSSDDYYYPFPSRLCLLVFMFVNRPRPLVCLQIIVHGMDQFMHTMGSFLHIKGQKNVTFIWFMLRNLFPTLPSLATKTSFILLGLIQAQRVRKIPCMPELSVHYVCKLMYVVSVKHTPFSLSPMCVHNSAAHHQWRSSLLCC